MRQEVARDRQITGYMCEALSTLGTVPSLYVNYANRLIGYEYSVATGNGTNICGESDWLSLDVIVPATQKADNRARRVLIINVTEKTAGLQD